MFALKLVVFCSLVVLSAQEAQEPVEILTEKTFVNEKGYHFDLGCVDENCRLNLPKFCCIANRPGQRKSSKRYKTSDGVSRQEEGQLITVGDQQGIGVKGTYSFVAPDGQQYIVSFTADDQGYKPTITIGSENSQ